jgi:hypothetical protein
VASRSTSTARHQRARPLGASTPGEVLVLLRDAEWQLPVKASLARTRSDRVPELSIARLERFAGSLVWCS